MNFYGILMVATGHRRDLITEFVTILLCLIFILFLSFSGCVRPDAGFTFRPEAFGVLPNVCADESTSQVTMSVGDTMQVSYPWSPEDGRFWRVTVTDGLFVSGDRYLPHPPDIPVEMSGTREWMVQAVSPGTHIFIGNLRSRATTVQNKDIIQNKITVTIKENEKNLSSGLI